MLLLRPWAAKSVQHEVGTLYMGTEWIKAEWWVKHSEGYYILDEKQKWLRTLVVEVTLTMFNTYTLIALQFLLQLDDVFFYYQFNSMPLSTFVHFMNTKKKQWAIRNSSFVVQMIYLVVLLFIPTHNPQNIKPP